MGLNYDFSRIVAGKFGYRYISVDCDKNGILYEMQNHGAYVVRRHTLLRLAAMITINRRGNLK